MRRNDEPRRGWHRGRGSEDITAGKRDASEHSQNRHDGNAPSDGVLVATIDKNAREQIRVAVRQYRGIVFVDVRTYAIINGAVVQHRPTKKGVAVRPGRVAELIAGLQQALHVASTPRAKR